MKFRNLFFCFFLFALQQPAWSWGYPHLTLATGTTPMTMSEFSVLDAANLPMEGAIIRIYKPLHSSCQEEGPFYWEGKTNFHGKAVLASQHLDPSRFCIAASAPLVQTKIIFHGILNTQQFLLNPQRGYVAISGRVVNALLQKPLTEITVGIWSKINGGGIEIAHLQTNGEGIVRTIIPKEANTTIDDETYTLLIATDEAQKKIHNFFDCFIPSEVVGMTPELLGHTGFTISTQTDLLPKKALADLLGKAGTQIEIDDDHLYPPTGTVNTDERFFERLMTEENTPGWIPIHCNQGLYSVFKTLKSIDQEDGWKVVGQKLLPTLGNVTFHLVNGTKLMDQCRTISGVQWCTQDTGEQRHTFGEPLSDIYLPVETLPSNVLHEIGHHWYNMLTEHQTSWTYNPFLQWGEEASIFDIPEEDRLTLQNYSEATTKPGYLNNYSRMGFENFSVGIENFRYHNGLFANKAWQDWREASNGRLVRQYFFFLNHFFRNYEN